MTVCGPSLAADNVKSYKENERVHHARCPRTRGSIVTSQTFTSSPAAVSFPVAVQSRTVDRAVRAWRAGRIAAGVGLVTGGLSLPVVALLDFPLGTLTMLHAAWLMSAAAALVAFAVSWAVPLAGRLGDRWLLASWAWPLAGLALVLPLTLHSLFIAATSAGELNNWVGLSWALVGHCHIALAGMAIRRVERLVHGERALSAPAIYGITVGLAMVPGAIFLLIPPVLVAFTGLPFLFLLWLPEVLIRRERALLGVAS
jgi:hypothetical protein